MCQLYSLRGVLGKNIDHWNCQAKGINSQGISISFQNQFSLIFCYVIALIIIYVGKSSKWYLLEMVH